MKHSNYELFKVNQRGYYTEDYIIANNIPKRKVGESKGWERCMWFTIKDQMTITTASGKITGYTYGEKTWFDTREERDAYREEMSQARNEQRRRNRLIEKITSHYEQMTTEELEKIVNSL